MNASSIPFLLGLKFQSRLFLLFYTRSRWKQTPLPAVFHGSAKRPGAVAFQRRCPDHASDRAVHRFRDRTFAAFLLQKGGAVEKAHVLHKTAVDHYFLFLSAWCHRRDGYLLVGIKILLLSVATLTGALLYESVKFQLVSMKRKYLR
jgi:hypothetical protein